ncbi:MAG: type I-U CRISPR-associated protein Csb2 [Candidatus Methylacidiphilales bacterium]
MPTFLKISVRFLLDEFDGRGDGGEPEWPPSPLRLFQTLTNSAARIGIDAFEPTLQHLETLPPPTIVANKPTAIQPRYGFKTFVPNNVGDLVAKSWTGGRDNNIANYRAAKEIRPTRLPENAIVAYLWEIKGEVPQGFVDQVRQLARAISAFGWGVNMVVADADVIESDTATDASGDTEKWFPSDNGVASLRVPISGTLAALERRHQAFLARLPTAHDGSQFFRPVPPLEHFRVLTYRRASDPIRPPFAIFALRQLDDSGFRAFDPVRRGLHVAAMLRHVAGTPDIARLLGWNEARIARLIHGHADEGPSASPNTRLQFLPLPSIEDRGEGKARVVGPIRRILISAHGPMEHAEFSRLAQHLNGLELIDEKTNDPAARLSRLLDSDKLTKDNYLASSDTWATVTPVILPGYDDPRKLRQRLNKKSGLIAGKKNALVAKLDQRIDQLLRKALRQAGYSEVITRHAVIEWRGSGYWPGTDLASRYMAGDQHRRFRKLHVRIQFRDEHGQPLPIAGPICLGGGKFSGTGLFAAIT